MSVVGLRFTPPQESYEGFQFRIATTMCAVFGLFSLAFLLKHVVVWGPSGDIDLLPGALHVLGSYMLAYYFRTLGGTLELLVLLGSFAAVFWLNLPKQYFAG